MVELIEALLFNHLFMYIVNSSLPFIRPPPSCNEEVASIEGDNLEVVH